MAMSTVHSIATAVRDAGGRALIVGGWVRDRLLELPEPDKSNVDLEVFGLPGDRVRALLESFGRVEAVGESFQVYKIGDIDVSLPRRDSKAGRGHRGFVVTGDPDMSIAEAARRRDFTLNAISWDPLTGEYFDPFDGRRDLERRLLRVVDPETFGDDSLRVLRGVQFVARFGLTHRGVDGRPLPADPARRLAGRARLGRVRKAALRADAIDRVHARRWISASIAKLFPELQALAGCPQEPEWHPEGDVWVHNLQVIDQARTRIDDLPRPQQLAVMLGAVCHDLGKPATTRFIDGRIRSLDHEEQGVAPAGAFLDRLNVNAFDGYDVRKQVLGITAQHLKPGSWFKVRDEVGDGAFRRLAHKVDLELLARVAKSDCEGRTPGQLRLHRDGLVSRAGARARRPASAAGTDPARPPPARAGPEARSACRRDSEGRLRATDGRNRHQPRRSDLSREARLEPRSLRLRPLRPRL